MIDKIKQFGFDNVAIIPVTDIPFDASLVKSCEMNTCGNYEKNYSCPPLIGNVDELINKAKSYQKALVFQKIYKIEDSFDIDGMNEGSANFSKITRDVKVFSNENIPGSLTLGAGGCRICNVCGAVDNVPCRFPDIAVQSLESYCIFVSALAEKCGMKYINGVNTVTYFGAVLYND